MEVGLVAAQMNRLTFSKMLITLPKTLFLFGKEPTHLGRANGTGMAKVQGVWDRKGLGKGSRDRKRILGRRQEEREGRKEATTMGEVE